VLYVVSLYSQPNLKPHPTAVSLTPSVCFHTPISNLITQLSNSLRQFVFTAHSRTSRHKCPTYSVSLYSQPNLRPHPTAVPITPSVCIQTESQTSPHSCPTHSISLYSQPNLKSHPTAVPITRSVFIHNPITNFTPQLPHSHRQSVFTTQSQTSPTAVPHNPSVCIHSPI
jgi:hypothetical protein